MRLVVVAVGHKMPDWVSAGFDEFARRMPRELPLELIEVKAETRGTGKTASALVEAESIRIEATLPARCRRVVLDERGADLTSMALARRLEDWQAGGDDVAFIIGGPDGLARTLKASAHEAIRLSSLTLPHALVRPLLAEALYRAWSINRHHPYHRA
ncbi:MAG: 23S rRNA (pseudouridine(1915)-N(3))-methyltransferase RlmH [Azoarcus sp.]|jgi:23S rRNA (pseudouridine1915-N3)-methyltransferase|nr:23S rRNA (pseudouridine(1915)-N(3))-methyltransferase RlmH [Azoarcus sp.]